MCSVLRYYIGKRPKSKLAKHNKISDLDSAFSEIGIVLSLKRKYYKVII